MEKNISIPTKFNPATQKYEVDNEKLNEKMEEINSKIEEENSNPNKNLIENKKAKEESFLPIILIMLAPLLIASLWDKIPVIKNSVNYLLNPTAGLLLSWNLNFGMLIIVFVITLITTIIQKYATDQKTLKELKKEQKEINKQMKDLKNDPKKMMELQKKTWQLMPKQMKLSMRALIYTGVPFILFFRWFIDYFEATGSPRFWLGMGWIVFYLLTAIIISSVLRKYMDVV